MRARRSWDSSRAVADLLRHSVELIEAADQGRRIDARQSAGAGPPGERWAIAEGAVAVLHAVQNRRIRLLVSIAEREFAAQSEAHVAPVADLQVDCGAQEVHPFIVEENQRDRRELRAIAFVGRLLDARAHAEAPVGHIRRIAQYREAGVVRAGRFRADTL